MHQSSNPEDDSGTRDLQLRMLAQADAQIALAEKRIDEQERWINEHRHGEQRELAFGFRLLGTMRESLEVLQEHRQSIRDALDRSSR